jgi:hypothetical protein
MLSHIWHVPTRDSFCVPPLLSVRKEWRIPGKRASVADSRRPRHGGGQRASAHRKDVSAASKRVRERVQAGPMRHTRREAADRAVICVITARRTKYTFVRRLSCATILERSVRSGGTWGKRLFT